MPTKPRALFHTSLMDTRSTSSRGPGANFDTYDARFNTPRADPHLSSPGPRVRLEDVVKIGVQFDAAPDTEVGEMDLGDFGPDHGEQDDSSYFPAQDSPGTRPSNASATPLSVNQLHRINTPPSAHYLHPRPYLSQKEIVIFRKNKSRRSSKYLQEARINT
ncbi:hypothetical protein EJ04DRAFT_209915 [Polyplosphaeria fusca]|uniref:Uncharacterized protein n=1 Tax=Polyplosphaeria fusca TaxID=682080 RepID=A0A9P4R6Z3_9PLEO|nr:hypothetical protein EJ04DRAFT_209915 [Polyplosphaeria fusca]